MRRLRAHPAGFTLIELLIAMSILALLLALSLPRYFGKLQESKEAALHEDLRIMRRAIDHFEADRGRYPDSLDELVTAQYLDRVPVDPITESRESWKLTSSDDVDKPGIVNVVSGADGASHLGTPYGDF